MSSRYGEFPHCGSGVGRDTEDGVTPANTGVRIIPSTLSLQCCSVLPVLLSCLHVSITMKARASCIVNTPTRRNRRSVLVAEILPVAPGFGVCDDLNIRSGRNSFRLRPGVCSALRRGTLHEVQSAPSSSVCPLGPTSSLIFIILLPSLAGTPVTVMRSPSCNVLLFQPLRRCADRSPLHGAPHSVFRFKVNPHMGIGEIHFRHRAS